MKKSITLLFILGITVNQLRAQSTIPNASFESWTTVSSYSVPDYWGCCNDMTSSSSTFTCMKGTGGVSGSTYMKLVSKTVTGMGVVPGIAVCGIMNTSTFQPISGFPFTLRPQQLTGSWQHMIYGSDQGYIDIQLTRWNGTNRVVVASAHKVLAGMAMSWATFSIPLSYVDSGTPDSCLMVMSASGANPTASDYLWVDNLAFTGSVTGLNEKMDNSEVTIYPNPASGFLSIGLSGLTNNHAVINIYDIQGKHIQSEVIEKVSSQSVIQISDLEKGNYMLSVITNKGVITKKFIKE